jgi:hypothetical protein
VGNIGREGLGAILQGAFEPTGMPSFSGPLSDEDVNVLYDYVSRGLHS